MTETNTATALTPISQAQRMLQEAKTLPDLKGLRSYAEGAKKWARTRGLGIETENEAAEVVIRAERAIGLILAQLRRDGLLRDGNPNGQKGLDESPRVFLSDLDLSPIESFRFQRAAALSDDEFEELLRKSKAPKPDGTLARIAKIDFYAKPRKPADEPAAQTPEHKGFAAFRKGVYALLGWEVDEDGAGVATRNDLLQLPNDELTQLAVLVKALIGAYNEAKEARNAA